MEEDTPGLRQSNSAPDLHVMLQEPMPSTPRMLLGPRQQPLGSQSAVGALVPYTATSTKVRHISAFGKCCEFVRPDLIRKSRTLGRDYWQNRKPQPQRRGGAAQSFRSSSLCTACKQLQTIAHP